MIMVSNCSNQFTKLHQLSTDLVRLNRAGPVQSRQCQFPRCHQLSNSGERRHEMEDQMLSRYL